MSPDGVEYDMLCQRAVTLIVDLCLHNNQLLDQDTCQEFLFQLSNQNSDHKEPDDIQQLLMSGSPKTQKQQSSLLSVS
ncbi:hypothetical protein DPEC_G00012520 [Dallia pectoralis]|uniref:Uncharacterized protein n=1 Tax=Dallia pectoralis TaxID=75939 RepID=A0ACC2HME1_DALPE|nr:hypothetical protein DPEC_G00012520 [Dallia pectoralis]